MEQVQMEIPSELKDIVFDCVKLLGQAIKETYGEQMFDEIENLRQVMKKLRNKNSKIVTSALEKLYNKSRKEDSHSLHQKAKAFSLMLELINTCEVSYRSYRLEHLKICHGAIPTGMVFVFTSHPTEARSPQLLCIMDKIEVLIARAIKTEIKEVESQILYLLKMALEINLATNKKPKVSDEAAQIFHTVLNPSILNEQLNLKEQGVNVFFNTWAGGDKDGHPLVGPATMIQSLSLSRNTLIDYMINQLNDFIDELRLLKKSRMVFRIKSLISKLLNSKKIAANDGDKIKKIKSSLERLKFSSPILARLNDLIALYPAIVIPLEIREDHKLVHLALHDPKQPIALMLKKLKKISIGIEPRSYVNSFVVSMCMSPDDLIVAAELTEKIMGKLEIPIVPLFENESGLANSTDILTHAFEKFPFKKIHKQRWGGQFEVMLGYSDSTKENGVLPGRLMVENAIHKIEKLLMKAKLRPVFFHGSGGSINRGGGSVKEQLSWLPKSSLDLYKATIQGESVQRHFHHALILRSQVNKIVNEFQNYRPNKLQHSIALAQFSKLIQDKYKSLLDDHSFQQLVQVATPYEFLKILRIGSRPAKRKGSSVFSIRAIPWTLCWTQTRLLLPIWWGVGSSWSELNSDQKNEILIDYKNSPIIQTYIKNLGFTLAKIEFGVWKFYVQHTGLTSSEKKYWNNKIENELKATMTFFKAMTGNLELLWFRPWLAQSIFFRSSMIHPLNVFQKISYERNDHILLRETVTGIACGMLTTG